MNFFTAFLPDLGFIRVLNSKGQIIESVQAEDITSQLEPEFVETFESGLYKEGIHRVLVVRIPFKSAIGKPATLEMAEELDSLEENIHILIYILVISSLAVSAMNVIGSVWLSKFILRPITGMVRTMEEIEKKALSSGKSTCTKERKMN